MVRKKRPRGDGVSGQTTISEKTAEGQQISESRHRGYVLGHPRLGGAWVRGGGTFIRNKDDFVSNAIDCVKNWGEGSLNPEGSPSSSGSKNLGLSGSQGRLKLKMFLPVVFWRNLKPGSD